MFIKTGHLTLPQT